jgi:CRISPR-associated protein Cmr1
VSEVRTYEFLTPVFGGGVEVQDHRKPFDPRTPIRVASVRGQLRFWWRACNPRCCTTIDDLRAKEAAVFGSTEQASALAISVTQQPGNPSPFPVLEGAFGAKQGLREIAYGAFPLRDAGRANNHGVLHEYHGSWQLTFTYPESVRLDVEAALWAWAHFGGLGGRTRRGFGAIAQTSPQLRSIDDAWAEYVSGLEVEWPHVQADRAKWLRCGHPKSDGLEAQKALLGKLQRLRQGPPGRKPSPESGGGNHPGRSYWPEADAIRKLTNRRANQHRQQVTNPDTFPRAAFGMPIIFHFKDQGDPHDSTLVPAGNKGRLSSPLILRPHRRPDGRVEPLALVLGHPAPVGYELKWGNATHPVRADLTRAEAQGMGVGGRPSPMKTISGQFLTDPLERFLEEIQ